ncbi:hypothetical protein [Microvirga zambiensis]|uniref:hypothetical protein n=1 Tax=Microvirga zambiensis TaxID=1402137 RepID=UPI00191E4AD7|nr:hypothetical protein [Microvirga zambiensis]
MQPRQVNTIEDARQILKDRDLSHVKVGVIDLDGIVRGKYMSRDKFFSALESGFKLCEVIFGWDSSDQLYPNAQFTGWHTAFPDAVVHIDPTTCRSVPEEGNMVFFLADFEGRAAELCPRTLLKKVISRADALEFKATVAAEFEFFVFDETSDSVRKKGYRNLETLSPGSFGYSTLRSSVHSEIYHDLMRLGAEMDVPLEGLHTETGPGVLEAAIEHTDALTAADRAIVFKTFSKIMAQRRGKMLTFMAKWSNNVPGQNEIAS